jgi:hypothetical protein
MRSRQITTAVATSAVGITTLLTAQFLGAATSAAASAPSCKATMSNYHPRQYSDVFVHVKTAKHAKVHTTAHYKTTSTSHSRRADQSGRASIDYYISGATPGYKVHVDVTVRKHGHSDSCSTWFTPRS